MRQVHLKYGQDDARDAGLLRQELVARGMEVTDGTQPLRRKISARTTDQRLVRSDYVVVLVSPESVASQAVMDELQRNLAARRFEDRILAVMIRPTFVLPWCFRKLPMFTLWDDRAAGMEHLVQAIKASGRRRAAG
jgi:hypothetical protein